MRRSFDPALAQGPKLSGNRIYENEIALGIHDCAIAELALESLQCGDAVSRRIGDLLEPGEVCRAGRQRSYLADILREAPENYRRVPCSLGKRRSHSRDVQGRSGGPVENPSQLPLFDQPDQEPRAIAKEWPAGSKGQLESAVAADGMCPVEFKKRFVERAVSGIQIVHLPVVTGFTQSLAPGIGRLIGEAVREPFGYLQVHRVVCGVARVPVQSHCHELRIDHNKILGKQSAVSQKPAALSGNGCGGVQEVCQLTHVAVGEKTTRQCVLTQRSRAGDSSRSDRSLSGVHDEPAQHLIEEERIATPPSGVESREDSVLKNVHIVEQDSAEKLRAFAADVSRFQRQVRSERVLNFQIPVLYILGDAIDIGCTQG